MLTDVKRTHVQSKSRIFRAKDATTSKEHMESFRPIRSHVGTFLSLAAKCSRRDASKHGAAAATERVCSGIALAISSGGVRLHCDFLRLNATTLGPAFLILQDLQIDATFLVRQIRKFETESLAFDL